MCGKVKTKFYLVNAEAVKDEINGLNPYKMTKFLDMTKFKAVAEDKLNVVKMTTSLFGYQHCLLFPHFFPRPSPLGSLKVWKRVKDIQCISTCIHVMIHEKMLDENPVLSVSNNIDACVSHLSLVLFIWILKSYKFLIYLSEPFSKRQNLTLIQIESICRGHNKINSIEGQRAIVMALSVRLSVLPCVHP